METIKIWESKQNENTTYFKDFESLKEYLQNNTIDLSLNVRNDFNSLMDKSRTMLDNIAYYNDISIIYTDSEHPITIYKFKDSSEIIIEIDPVFFNNHLEEFCELSKSKFEKELNDEKETFISIPDYIVTDELVDKIISSKKYCKAMFIINKSALDTMPLSKENIDKLKKAFVDVTYYGEEKPQKISTNKVIQYYNIEEVKNLKFIHFYIGEISEEELDNFIYLPDNVKIFLYPSKKSDEKEYFSMLKRIFSYLGEHNKKYNIEIEIDNRVIFENSELIKTLPNNIELSILNCYENYSKNQYIEQEKKLNDMVAKIRDSDLSPYEKYLAVFNIVKQFKEYKENNDDKEQSRKLKCILDNEYIVCVGYSALLMVLLDKVGIKNKSLGVSVDISYDEGFTQEEKEQQYSGHARVLVRIDDEKYNIHGIYISDPTWSNSQTNDLYQTANMTFDRTKESIRLETLSDDDLLLDFHNIEEYYQKIEYLLKKDIKSDHHKEHNKKMVSTYQNIYIKMLAILKELDYESYQMFCQKYDNKILYFGILNENTFQVMDELFTDYAKLIIPLSNQNIEFTTTLKAAIAVKRKIDGMNTEQLKEWLRKTIDINKHENKRQFPYKFDPDNECPNFLDTIDEEVPEGRSR